MQTLTMKFKNKMGKNVSIRLAKVKAGITKAEAFELMDIIIAKDIFYPVGSELVEKVSASVSSNTELA